MVSKIKKRIGHISSKAQRRQNQKKNNTKSRKQTRQATPHIKQCKKLLRKNISKMIAEYKNGRWKSPQQAVAVAYSKTKRVGCTFKQ
jgi:hypothetical protein